MPGPTPRTASLGNQNGRTSGISSRLEPLSDDDINALARQAAAAGDHHQLHQIARAVRYRGLTLRIAGQPHQEYYERAAGLRAIARRLEEHAAGHAADAILREHH